VLIGPDSQPNLKALEKDASDFKNFGQFVAAVHAHQAKYFRTGLMGPLGYRPGTVQNAKCMRVRRDVR